MADEGVWRTVRGRRIFIAKGQSLSDAIKESGKFERKLTANLIRMSQDEETWEEYDKTVVAIQEQYGLDDKEVEAINSYTDEDYKRINNDLANEGYDKSMVKEKIDVIDSALDKMPDEKGLSFSGRKEDLYISKDDIGKTVQMDAFISSSKSSSAYTVMMGSKWLSVIEGKHGKLISPMSKYPYENEVLFKRGTKFKITRFVEKGLGNIPNVYMEEVD